MTTHRSKVLFYIPCFWILMISTTFGQEYPDSTTYETQRTRVNNLLEDRSRKFGEYDVSLEKKTGIFGIFKTKSDMQKSIDILKEIVITDNKIFLETKRLIDIKDFEKEKYQELASEYDQQVTAYMKTISKLQEQNEALKLEMKDLQDEEHDGGVLNYILVLIIAILCVLLFIQYRKYNLKN